MNKIVKLFSGIVLLASVVTMNACKKSFDNPPAPSDDVNIVANTTIATLKSLHTLGGVYDVINSDIIISGIVTANDKSGNLYKQIFIQDTTGAMQILIEASSVYGTFPVGRRVFIRCQGLCITDYHGTNQVGVLTHTDAGPAVQGILASDIGKYIVGGSLNNDVTPIPVTASDLGTSIQDRYINALIRLDDYEFQTADTAFTYSDTSAYKNTVNRTIKNCSGSTVLVRNSAYANFTAVKLPKGHGSIAAIYTIYKSTPTSSSTDKQLLLRDTTDVQFYGERCGSAPSNALLFENFEGYPANTTSPYSVLAIPGWQNLVETGLYKYTNRTFSSNKYAYTSPFGVPTQKSWLVTKGVNLNATATETLTFDTKQDFLLAAYPGGANVASLMEVKYSLDYDGTSNPWTQGTWTTLPGAILSAGSTTSAFPSNYTGSGNIDLSGYSGTIHIAFINSGGTNVPVATSSWEIDNIKIVGN
ncbi:MAG: DUF5689 domain-containing protein [Ferruginibacter sp.]